VQLHITGAVEDQLRAEIEGWNGESESDSEGDEDDDDDEDDKCENNVDTIQKWAEQE
jgi:hypothetical protein